MLNTQLVNVSFMGASTTLVGKSATGLKVLITFAVLFLLYKFLTKESVSINIA